MIASRMFFGLTFMIALHTGGLSAPEGSSIDALTTPTLVIQWWTLDPMDKGLLPRLDLLDLPDQVAKDEVSFFRINKLYPKVGPLLKLKTTDWDRMIAHLAEESPVPSATRYAIFLRDAAIKESDSVSAAERFRNQMSEFLNLGLVAEVVDGYSLIVVYWDEKVLRGLFAASPSTVVAPEFLAGGIPREGLSLILLLNALAEHHTIESLPLWPSDGTPEFPAVLTLTVPLVETNTRR